MSSQMHQPDVLLLVKESLSVSRESPLFHIPQQERRKPDCHGNFKFIMSFLVFSSLRWSGSWFSCQGACGHLQREKEVTISDIFQSYWIIYLINKFDQFAHQIYKQVEFLRLKRNRIANRNWNCYFPQQWPDLQSECKQWKCIPDHLFSFCASQSRTPPPATGFGPPTLGPGMLLVKTVNQCSFEPGSY